MGVYNIYAGVQLKVEPDCDLSEYKIGDKVPLPDGVYVGNEGFVVIIKGILIGMFPTITTKWGDSRTSEDVLVKSDPYMDCFKGLKMEEEIIAINSQVGRKASIEPMLKEIESDIIVIMSIEDFDKIVKLSSKYFTVTKDSHIVENEKGE